MFCYNINAKYFSQNPVMYQRSKHIEMDIDIICEQVLMKQLLMEYYSSHDQLADLLTKPLPR